MSVFVFEGLYLSNWIYLVVSDCFSPNGFRNIGFRGFQTRHFIQIQQKQQDEVNHCLRVGRKAMADLAMLAHRRRKWNCKQSQAHPSINKLQLIIHAIEPNKPISQIPKHQSKKQPNVVAIDSSHISLHEKSTKRSWKTQRVLKQTLAMTATCPSCTN